MRHLVRGGMTIMETLVMLAILGVFGTIAYPLLGTTMAGIRRNQARAVQVEVGRDALRELTTHVRQLGPLPGAASPVLVGKNGGAGAIAQDRLSVTTTDLSRLGHGTRFTVEYFVSPADAAAQVPARLMRRLTAADGSSREVVVGANIVAFDCAYLSGGVWAAEWPGPGP